MKPTDTPQCYLSHSSNGWCLILREAPLCDYKRTATEALQVAQHFKIEPHKTHYWNGITGDFEPRADADHHQPEEAAAFTLQHSPAQCFRLKPSTKTPASFTTTLAKNY